MLKYASLKQKISFLQDSSVKFLAQAHSCQTQANLKILNDQTRINELGIQMINEKLRQYLFRDEVNLSDSELVQKAQEHLKMFNLQNKKSDIQKEISDFELPRLGGKNIEEHFINIARKQTNEYLKLISKLTNNNIPEIPSMFQLTTGWTK